MVPADARAVLLFLLTAGLVVALGPYGFGAVAHVVPIARLLTIDHDVRIAVIGELGVVFLLFMLGLELSFERLSTMRRLVFGLGPLQVGVSALALSGVAAALGMPFSVAVVMGGALALSSTAIVVPVLAERRRLNTAAGRTAF